MTMMKKKKLKLRQSLSEYQRELIREARHVQRVRTEGEVQYKHIIIQTAYGWTGRSLPKKPEVSVPDKQMERREAVQQQRQRRLREENAAAGSAFTSRLREQTRLRDRMREAVGYDAEDNSIMRQMLV